MFKIAHTNVNVIKQPTDGISEVRTVKLSEISILAQSTHVLGLKMDNTTASEQERH